MSYEGSFGQKCHQISDAIHEKCVGCVYGADDYGRTLCRHPSHPGTVGGAGTEWALNCDHYRTDGKRGRVVTTTIRE